MKLQSHPNTIKGDMEGTISLQFKPNSSINDYCAKNIPNYDPDRLEVMAIRFYHGAETIVTCLLYTSPSPRD